MHRKRLVASAAMAPLLILASGALAQETTITDARTTPVQTSDSNQDVRVTSTGSIRPTSGGGPALEMDTDNDITNEGAIQWTDAAGPVSGMQGAGGLTGDIVNRGTIRLDEDYTPEDDDDDGDLDGPFAEGADRYGIRVTPGTGAFEGSITNDTSGVIVVEGEDSAGIWVEADLDGSLVHRGTISVTGDGGYGIRTEGAVSGDLDLRGGVTVLGEDSVAVLVEGDVDGVLRIQGAVTSRGYRYTSLGAVADVEDLDADDLKQGGGGVVVAGDVAGGIILDIAPTEDEDEDEDDEDGDGVDDDVEGNGSISVFGEAPALLIGSATDSIVIGQVAATGDDAHGVVLKGQVSASGVFEGVSATGVQIGGQGGASTALTGGMRVDGSITAQANGATATALSLGAGATLGADGALVNDGSIVSQAANVSAPLADEVGQAAYGVRIGAGATAPTLTNSGVIGATVAGEKGTAVAVLDESGTLTTITNTGRIQAVISPTDDPDDTDDADNSPNNEVIDDGAQRVAIDVSAATQGVTVTQDDQGPIEDDPRPDSDDDGIADADEPLIWGDVRFGSGADTLNLRNGSLVGNVTFGDGADTLNIEGGAIMQGRLLGTAPGSELAIDLADGRLFITETDTIHGTSLDVGGEGVLIVTIDPDTEESTRFVVDTADFADGAQVGVDVKGLLTFDNLADTNDYLIVDAGTLNAGDIDESLLGNAPYIYVVGVDADEATGEVNLAIRRRRAGEAGFNAAQAAAFDAIYAALGGDEDIQTSILNQQTRAGFLRLYDQLLPDQGEGIFSALDMAQVSIARAIATKPDLRRRYGPDSLWVQELNLQVKRDGGETLGSEAKAFGFVAGYEAMNNAGGALGATLAYVTAEENDDAATVGEQTTVSQLEGGVYWRRSAGAWLFSARGGAGYAWFDGTRRFIDPQTQLVREASADWSGFTASAHGGVQYEQRFGRFYARPGLFLDYFYLSEGEREEEGGLGLNQTVEERSSSRLSGTAEVAFGAEFGRDFWWRPEVRLGYRHILAGEVGDTTAMFPGGDPFTISAMDPGAGAAIVALALKMGTGLSYLALEGEMEAAENEQRYNLKLTGRVMF